MFSTGLEGTAAAAKVFGTSCGWMRTASCAVGRQRDVILSRAGWDGRLRTAVVCGSVRLIFALLGHGGALRGRGTPCVRLSCFVVASCASKNLLSDLAGAGAHGPLFVHSLRNSCAFAACVRPLHTSMFILLRGFCAGWSPRSLQDVRLGDAERVIVL